VRGSDWWPVPQGNDVVAETNGAGDVVAETNGAGDVVDKSVQPW
jgi:hypothetical protein